MKEMHLIESVEALREVLLVAKLAQLLIRICSYTNL